ncbi:energy transducer TonB [Flavobacteriaceae bacterium]|jgi:protein TonB|nr:energy transducer TonB [Flavobacteriaceae bacterium]
MENKKNPKVTLDNYSKIFMQLGLVLALFISYVVIEKKSFKHYKVLQGVSMDQVLNEEPPIIESRELETPKIEPPVQPEKIEVIDDDEDVNETVILPTDPDETEALEIVNIKEEDEPEELIEDVPFILIEDVPVFPGCIGSKKELKACFNKKMQKHFGKKFNADLPNDLGMSPGKKRIIMLFKINKFGDIVDVRAKAPHPLLQREAVRIIKLLPKMKPGRFGGKAVGVKYTLPMRIEVE